PEEPAVEKDEHAHRPRAARPSQREREGDQARHPERGARQADGEKCSLPVRAGMEHFPEEVGVEACEHPCAEGYFTSPAGICCFAASLFSVPFFFSVTIADLSAFPSFVSDFR